MYNHHPDQEIKYCLILSWKGNHSPTFVIMYSIVLNFILWETCRAYFVAFTSLGLFDDRLLSICSVQAIVCL